MKNFNKFIIKSFKERPYWHSFVTVAVILLVTFVAMNYGSKDIVLASLGAVTAIITLWNETSPSKKCLAGTALVAAALTLYFGMASDELVKGFRKGYIYHLKTGRPIPTPHLILNVIQNDGAGFTRVDQLINTQAFTNSAARYDGKGLALTYGDILMRQMIELLYCTYSQTYQTVRLRSGSPFEHHDTLFFHPPGPQENVPWEAFQRGYPENHFFEIRPYLESTGGVAITGFKMPPGTKLKMKPYNLTFENKLGTIEIAFGGSMPGDIDKTPVPVFVGMPPSEFTNYVYEYYNIQMAADFSKWHSGDPAMKKYQKWAAQMFELLEERFDTTRRWDEALQAYSSTVLSQAPWLEAESSSRNRIGF